MKKRENIIIIVVLIIMVISIIGVSYAAFRFSQTGNTANTITTGSITMTYTETSNTISINGALPTTDKTGMVRLNPGEYFDFTVSSEIVGDVNINYEISAKEVGDGTIDGSNIKLYLTKLNSDGTEEGLMVPETYNEESSSNSYTGRPANEMSLYTSSMNSSESNNYRLRMYVDEGYNPQGDGGGLTFSVRINVYGQAGDKIPVTTGPVSEVLLSSVGENGEIDTSDSDQTFITGENPNNYIWYSGKLWRAVSINPSDNSVKLVTQWNISSSSYNSAGNATFEESHMEEWLNDTTVDGFLGNLRDYENFIVTDAKWNATLATETTKPTETTIVSNAVGLLNVYEYTMSYNGTTSSNGYLNNGINWWTLTPYSTNNVNYVDIYGELDNKGTGGTTSGGSYGIRPSINLKPTVEVVSGDGTENNPYRLKGDNDSDVSGMLLNTRYSGEYIRFGNDENNLYRIVSHENGTGTKIVSAEPLKDAGSFITSAFGSNVTFSSTNTIGAFLNGDYLTNYVDSEYNNMIEDSTTWYLGTVGRGASYKLAKYTDATGNTLTSNTAIAKVGLLRVGELMSGQFDARENNHDYWLITSATSSVGSSISVISTITTSANFPTKSHGIKPALNLKSNVVITSGDGTLQNPFEIELAS